MGWLSGLNFKNKFWAFDDVFLKALGDEQSQIHRFFAPAGHIQAPRPTFV